MRLLGAAIGSVGPSEVREAPSGLVRIRWARPATQLGNMPENGRGSPVIRGPWTAGLYTLQRATQEGNMPENGSSEAIGRVEKIVKEEMGERRRGAILAWPSSGLVGRRLASFKLRADGRSSAGVVFNSSPLMNGRVAGVGFSVCMLG